MREAAALIAPWPCGALFMRYEMHARPMEKAVKYLEALDSEHCEKNELASGVMKILSFAKTDSKSIGGNVWT